MDLVPPQPATLKAAMSTNTGDLFCDPSRSYEFAFPDLDTLVMVQETEDELVVRATRDTFSERRKIHFIRELAAEGFVLDSYQWVCDFATSSRLPVRWRVDASWLRIGEAQAARVHLFMIGLMLSATVLWLGMMATLFILK